MSGCAFRRVTTTRDITYQPVNLSKGTEAQKLDVYAPKKTPERSPVLIFVHGGNWNSGNKNLYKFLGKRLARKKITAVIISYPLSPGANYQQMETAVRNAVQWTRQNIGSYGADANQLFLSGHSAGGHLAALVGLRQDTVAAQRLVKGLVLIDAAGLDMHGYLHEAKFSAGHTYLKTFTADSTNWKDATPLFHFHQNMVPMLVYMGGKTYPSIQKSTARFLAEAKAFNPAPVYHLQKGKHHIPMILQFFWTWNPRYKQIKTFMQSVPK